MLERFVEEYAARGYQFAYHLCGNAEDAKELLQEAFVRLFRSWGRYDPSQPLENWFLTILKNLYFDWKSRLERRSRVSLDFPGGPEGTLAETLPDPSEEGLLERLERRESGEEVRRALGRLSPEHRAVLVLCDMEGLGYAQIAEALDCPLGTVRSRVNRARAALRRHILETEEAREA